MSRLKLPNRTYRAVRAAAWGMNRYLSDTWSAAVAERGYNAGYAQALRDVHRARRVKLR